MTENRITTEISVSPFVYAPVNIGDEIGKLTYYYDGRYIDSLPMKAMKTVEYKENTEKNKEKSVWEKIKAFLFN